MASRAAEAREQSSALRDQIAGGALAREPSRKVRLAHDDDRADHSGMSGPAELSAEEVEDARLGRPKAGLDIPPWQDVLLDAKGRHRERMDDVLRSHIEPHRLVHRHVKRVDLSRAVRVLDLPHPLLGDNVDLHRVAWRQKLRHFVRPGPPKQHQESEQSGAGPSDLEFMLDERRQGSALGGRAAPIADRENDNEGEDEKDNSAGYCEQREIERVGLRREGRGLTRQERDHARSLAPARDSKRSPTATASSVAAPAVASRIRTGPA